MGALLEVNPAGIWCSCRICPCWNSIQALKPCGDYRQADHRRHYACRPGQPWSLQPTGGGFTGNQSLG
ncbi:hypothetical protein ACLK19_18250 [Escherichia coli]